MKYLKKEGEKLGMYGMSWIRRIGEMRKGKEAMNWKEGTMEEMQRRGRKEERKK